MRDLIWTLIVLWFAYRIVNIFRKGDKLKMKKPGSGPASDPEGLSGLNGLSGKAAGTPSRKRLDTEGEYVDFEEIS